MDGDGHFCVRVTRANKKRNYPIVECRFEIKKKISINYGYDYEPIMNILALAGLPREGVAPRD
jgi:hypothetical protein